ncbi:MAG: OmpA family protein [Bacteroidales bacterium]|nr:OmpA family protein [Bacteroidales bacterium]
MKTTLIKFTIVILYIILLSGCVPPQYVSEIESERDNCKTIREELWIENEKLTVQNTELQADLEFAKTAKARMEEMGLKNAEELKNLKARHSQLSKRYNELEDAHKTLINGSDAETRQLLGRLENTQKDLYQHEDQLNQAKIQLDKERDELNALKNELQKQNAQLLELEDMLTEKDKEAEALKQKLSAALTGFENQGLTITKKNGKVYVSLEEKLLFGSGSTQVDAKGIEALNKLARVLEQNQDIFIMIEGHTDDVPVISGSKFEDNWDLSVQRATAIIRILLDGSSIDPKRLTAAGRGEFMPVDPRTTAEARQKNRRTEIILTPNLDEVFELLE